MRSSLSWLTSRILGRDRAKQQDDQSYEAEDAPPSKRQRIEESHASLLADLPQLLPLGLSEEESSSASPAFLSPDQADQCEEEEEEEHIRANLTIEAAEPKPRQWQPLHPTQQADVAGLSALKASSPAVWRPTPTALVASESSFKWTPPAAPREVKETNGGSSSSSSSCPKAPRPKGTVGQAMKETSSASSAPRWEKVAGKWEKNPGGGSLLPQAPASTGSRTTVERRLLPTSEDCTRDSPAAGSREALRRTSSGGLLVASASSREAQPPSAGSLEQQEEEEEEEEPRPSSRLAASAGSQTGTLAHQQQQHQQAEEPRPSSRPAASAGGSPATAASSREAQTPPGLPSAMLLEKLLQRREKAKQQSAAAARVRRTKDEVESLLEMKRDWQKSLGATQSGDQRRQQLQAEVARIDGMLAERAPAGNMPSSSSGAGAATQHERPRPQPSKRLREPQPRHRPLPQQRPHTDPHAGRQQHQYPPSRLQSQLQRPQASCGVTDQVPIGSRITRKENPGPQPIGAGPQSRSLLRPTRGQGQQPATRGNAFRFSYAKGGAFGKTSKKQNSAELAGARGMRRG